MGTVEPDQGFSAALRSATWSDHGDNEGSSYMSALVEGRLGQAEYAVLVAQLYHVYDVLEQAADQMAGDPVAAAFDFADLRRRAALQADLAFFYGPDWAERIALNEATRRYCDRLGEVCFDWAGGFVAHHYTRYLGDLSGGQYIARQVERSLGIGAGDDGVRFYRFPGKPKGYKDRYRALLDAAPWDEREKDRIISEVKLAYRLNAEVTAELSRELHIEPAA
ncbi:biliverdin-producing heme oxygenase [Actinomadura rudentiformis]|uniref:Biliverdin-producing heme oxygenase n=1 Tax=Actinomadura rudentiformis TaxID=359158 RepID=A0A6H9Z3E6_9ACTN|nr:biliverdin-producing heme oxygenase [Actinomadura rudentiformis]KAB2348967.1 biliverdin-producing heme oxygenase [Actinomadura rudentiformis]